MILRDQSNKYFEYKEIAKEEKKKRDQNEFLTFVQNRPISIRNSQDSSNNSGFSKFPNIFINKPPPPPPIQQQQPQKQENLINLPYCSSCGKEFGLFTSSIKCDLCLISFCGGCLKKITSKDITGVLREGQVKQYCSKCTFLVTREEKERRFKFSCEKSQSHPLLLLYYQLSDLKKAINSRLPNFEYLGSSVTDFNKVTAKNKETFLQVYDEVIRLQNDLVILFKEFDKKFKEILTVQVQKDSLNEKVFLNMRQLYLGFLQQNLPKFNKMKTQIQHIELNTVTNIYIILCCISMDNQLQREFWSKYKDAFQTTISVIRKDLFQATLKCGEVWETHKGFIDEMICNTEKSLLNLDKGVIFEGTLLRKNKEVLLKIQEQVYMRTKSDELVQSKKSLSELSQFLSNTYESSMSFQNNR